MTSRTFWHITLPHNPSHPSSTWAVAEMRKGAREAGAEGVVWNGGELRRKKKTRRNTENHCLKKQLKGIEEEIWSPAWRAMQRGDMKGSHWDRGILLPYPRTFCLQKKRKEMKEENANSTATSSVNWRCLVVSVSLSLSLSQDSCLISLIFNRCWFTRETQSLKTKKEKNA